MGDSRPKGLIDTGALLALVDGDDQWHRRCKETYDNLQLPLATSIAVLTEFFHLSSHPRDKAAGWGVLCSGAIRILPIGNDDLPDLQTLMDRYHDRPMDFADATLVHLAKREQLDMVFTIDHDDFETYRIDGRRRFRIVPTR
jgi:predicted nucleic acid-binding protein